MVQETISGKNRCWCQAIASASLRDGQHTKTGHGRSSTLRRQNPGTDQYHRTPAISRPLPVPTSRPHLSQHEEHRVHSTATLPNRVDILNNLVERLFIRFINDGNADFNAVDQPSVTLLYRLGEFVITGNDDKFI